MDKTRDVLFQPWEEIRLQSLHDAKTIVAGAHDGARPTLLAFEEPSLRQDGVAGVDFPRLYHECKNTYGVEVLLVIKETNDVPFIAILLVVRPIVARRVVQH